MVKISYIIPVYNVELYLRQCLDSVVNQTINDKEIILIDDGSTDRSYEICKEYQKKYDYIIVISKKNEGQSCARNDGLKYAKGEYVQFVDSDDVIDIKSGEIFYSLCKKYNLDMIRGKYYTFFEKDNKKVIQSNFEYNEKSCLVENAQDYFIRCIKNNIYEVTPILGLIKTKYIKDNNIKFAPDLKMEDHEFTLKCLLSNKEARVMQLDYTFYTYRRRANSTTTTPSIKNISDIVEVSKLMKDFINQSNFDNELLECANNAVSALVYQATSIYGRLEKNEKLKVDEILTKDILRFSIKNAISNHNRMKIMLFTYFRWSVDLVYLLKSLK